MTRYAISATAAPEVKYQKKRAMDGKRSISLSCGGGGEGTATAAGGASIRRVPPVVVSSSDDTELRVWAVDTGAEIARLDTLQFKNHNAAVSPDGRFVAAAAFTADVKIWEVLRSKQGGVSWIKTLAPFVQFNSFTARRTRTYYDVFLLVLSRLF